MIYNDNITYIIILYAVCLHISGSVSCSYVYILYSTNIGGQYYNVISATGLWLCLFWNMSFIARRRVHSTHDIILYYSSYYYLCLNFFGTKHAVLFDDSFLVYPVSGLWFFAPRRVHIYIYLGTRSSIICINTHTYNLSATTTAVLESSSRRSSTWPRRTYVCSETMNDGTHRRKRKKNVLTDTGRLLSCLHGLNDRAHST